MEKGRGMGNQEMKKHHLNMIIMIMVVIMVVVGMVMCGALLF